MNLRENQLRRCGVTHNSAPKEMNYKHVNKASGSIIEIWVTIRNLRMTHYSESGTSISNTEAAAIFKIVLNRSSFIKTSSNFLLSNNDHSKTDIQIILVCQVTTTPIRHFLIYSRRCTRFRISCDLEVTACITFPFLNTVNTSLRLKSYFKG